MNTNIKKEENILETAMQNLNEQIHPDEAILVTDKVIRIKDVDFACEVKGNVTNANANIVLNHLLEIKSKSDKPLLLVVKYIYPSIMEVFAEQGIHVLDGAGNCIIRHNSILLKVKGQKSVLAKESVNLAFQETGIRLIFHFLLHPESIKLPYRAIGEETNISLGSIKKIIDDLTANHFILKTDNGRFLKNRKKLLESWVTAYNQTLKPKLLLESMAFANNEKRDKWQTLILPEGMYWGGEPGANVIDKYLYPGTFEIYSDISAKLFLKTGFAVPKEEGEIKIYRKFWLDNQENNIVPALLIYADLMGSGSSRCLEAAQKIYENECANFE